MAKLQVAVQAMANVPVKRGFNQWQTVIAEERAAKALLLSAVRGIINSKVRKVCNAWSSMVAEKREYRRKLEMAVASMSPEGRAKRAVLFRLTWVVRRRAAMQKAMAGFVLAGCRRSLRMMSEQLEMHRKLRRGGNAIRLRKARACWNVWAEVASDAKGRQGRMKVFLMKMTPEGRMMNYGFQILVEQLEERRRMRAALSGFIMSSTKRAMGAWIEATFVSFNLAAGMDGHVKFKLRKAIGVWVARGKVRKGLRRQVWLCAQKGVERDLARLLEMMDDSDSDDIANAIVALDKQGSTPLLWAAKKGFADVAETLIGTVNNIVGDGKGVLSAKDIAAMVNTADSDGNSALHWAARKDHMAVAVQLLEAGASVDKQNKEDSTPLHWAARKHNEQMLRLLLDAGARMDVVNKWGATALDNAEAVNRTADATLLLRSRATAAKSRQQQQQQQQQQQGSSPDDKAWGEGPGLSDGAPKGVKAQAAKRRHAANERREAALRAREEQEKEKGEQQALRRKRAVVEMRLKELCDSMLSEAALPKAKDPRARSPPDARSRSPPKASQTKELREALSEAKELGGCNTTVIGAAESKLKQAEELRERQKRDAARQAERERGRSPSKGGRGQKRPGEKSEEEKLANLERKMLRKARR